MRVWAQIGENGLPIKIFKHDRDRLTATGLLEIREMEKKDAVCSIRRQVWKRQNGECIRCGDIITWLSGHMHEKVSRGKGGAQSLENCEMLCYPCHLGSRGVHPNRQLNFRRKT